MTIEQMGIYVSIDAELDRLDANLKKSGHLVSTTVASMDKSTKRAVRSFESLEKTMDRSAWVARKYEKDADKIRRAHESGHFSAERIALAYKNLNDRYERMSRGVGRTTAALASNDNAVSNLSGRMTRLGPVMQQAGYQVGDFAVQVASGQSAMVAFTQQGSQLLGFFGPWGAVIGAGAAVAGALAMALWDTGDAADGVSGSLEEYKKSVEEAEKFVKRLNDEQRTSAELLRQERDEILQTARVRLDAAQAELDRQKAQLEFHNRAVRTMQEGNPNLGFETVSREGLQPAIDALAMAQAEFDSLRESMDRAIDSNQEFKRSQEDSKAAEKTATEISRQTERIKEYISGLQYQLNVMQMTDRQQAISNAVRQAGTNVTSQQAERIRELSGELYDYQQRLNDLNDALDREQKLMDEGASVTEANRTAQEKYNDEIERLDGLLAANAISQETYGRAASKAFDDMAKAQANVSEVGKDVGRVLSNSLSDVSGWAEDASGQVFKLGEAFASLILQKSVMEPAADAIGGAIGNMDWGSLFTFADGGVMTGDGPLPLRKYSEGGIANTPQLAMFGETSVPEAYVPVPSGKIPVDIRMPKMTAQSNGPSSVFNIDARGADQAAIARLEGTIKVLGGEVRRIDSTFDKRAVGAVGNAARRGGSSSAAIRGR